MATLFKTIPAFTALLGLALAYDGLGESYASGDLLDTNTPWSIAESAFGQALSQPNATGSAEINGYNISSVDFPDSRNWTLRISLKADVPLSSTKATSLPDEARAKYTHITTLGVDIPEPGLIADTVSTNRLCGLVYPGLSDEAARKGQSNNNNCEAALGSQCARELEAAGLAANSDRAVGCRTPAIPDSCITAFPRNLASYALGMSLHLHLSTHLSRTILPTSSPTRLHARAPRRTSLADIQYLQSLKRRSSVRTASSLLVHSRRPLVTTPSTTSP
jgi:hypothetical protein